MSGPKELRTDVLNQKEHIVCAMTRSRLIFFAMSLSALFCAGACRLAADSTIEKAFYEHQTEFDTLKTMLNEESSIVSFAKDYILRTNGVFSFKAREPPEQEIGMP